MERTPLESSAVRSAGYDDESQTLELEFKMGRIYQYSAVPRGVFEWLLRTPRKGEYVNRMIDGKYPHLDVTPRSGTAESDLARVLSESLRWAEDKPKP